jgi:hypothetical protein
VDAKVNLQLKIYKDIFSMIVTVLDQHQISLTQFPAKIQRIPIIRKQNSQSSKQHNQHKGIPIQLMK